MTPKQFQSFSARPKARLARYECQNCNKKVKYADTPHKMGWSIAYGLEDADSMSFCKPCYEDQLAREQQYIKNYRKGNLHCECEGCGVKVIFADIFENESLPIARGCLSSLRCKPCYERRIRLGEDEDDRLAEEENQKYVLISEKEYQKYVLYQKHKMVMREIKQAVDMKH